MKPPTLALDEIQGDVLEGLQKNIENFVFFKIINSVYFKTLIKQYVVSRVTSAEQVNNWGTIIRRRKGFVQARSDRFHGLNLGFSHNGLTQLIRAGLPKLDPAFDRGADHQDTIKALNDPPRSTWLKEFVADRIDGVFLVTGPDRPSVTLHSNEVLRLLGASIKVVYSEIGNTRPGAERGHEHFGFLDGVSQPGIRGLTESSDPRYRPGQGLPGQDLLWPGELVFGYSGQDPYDPVKKGSSPPMAASWLRNGSYMVFRRLEQKVPEFRKFVAEQAARLGMDRELLAARMVGRRRSGAPLELAPLHDNPALGADATRNNDFEFGDDPFQRRCPYAAHIRKAYPRDDTASAAEVERHRIIRRDPVWSRGGAQRNHDAAQPGTDVRVLSDLDRAAVRVHTEELCEQSRFRTGKKTAGRGRSGGAGVRPDHRPGARQQRPPNGRAFPQLPGWK